MATRDETDIQSDLTAGDSGPWSGDFGIAHVDTGPTTAGPDSAAVLSAIGEPSFADAIALIGRDESLKKTTRIHWATSLRRMADFLGRPPECIPARLTSVRQPINRLNPASLGIAPKTYANHKSNVRAALSYLRSRGLTPPRGTPQRPDWASLVDAVPLKHFRITLMPFARYCSGRGIAPAGVATDVVSAFFVHREQTTFREVGLCRRRDLARAWNHARATVEGWPDFALEEEPLPAASAGPGLEEFPQTLRDEIDRYIEELVRPRRSPNGKRLRPSRPSTVQLRRRELAAYMRKAVACGHPIADLRTLRDLLVPDTVRRVLESYWPDEDKDPSQYVISLSWKLFSIAREVGCLTETELASLDDLQSHLASFHRSGLTPKNMAVVRQVVTTDAWSRVIRLPDTLMDQARARRDQSPVRAAVLAGIAIAIRLLTVAPVRIANLSAIRLDENLIRPAGPGTPLTLIFADHDTKNRVPLEFPLDKAMTAMIDEYVHTFRPALMRGHNSDWLFPSENGGHKRPATLGPQICEQVKRHVGFAVTPHQFRHAAAAIILKAKPGDYELVRRVLGHRSINTTINFYVGLESVDAARAFGQLVAQRLAARRDDTDDDD